jgi:probable phosphomutase (TIGR03848 family)
MKLLLLLRHAVTEQTGARLSGWTPGLHLSEAGHEQARHLAERLAQVPLDAVYASPLERCQETAAALVGPRGLEVGTLEDLGEVRYGAWTGRTLKELSRETLWKAVQAHPSGARFPDGESLFEMQARAVAALERLRAAHPGGQVAVCSHADVIKAVVAHYLGLHLDLFQRLVVGPASVTAVGFGSAPYLLRLNDTGAAADLVPPRRGRRGRKEAVRAQP